MPKRLRRYVWRETSKSILIYPGKIGGGPPQIWLPKSVIAVVKKEWGHWEIIIPDWLTRKHNLADASFEEPEEDIPFNDPDPQFYSPSQQAASKAALEVLDKCSREAEQYRRDHKEELEAAEEARRQQRNVVAQQSESNGKIDLLF